MADVILVQPRSEFLDRLQVHPNIPLNLLALASRLDSYNVRIIDQRTEPGWRGQLKRHLRTDPVAVGISSITGKQISSALDISQFVKKHSAAAVVWGGPHATLEPRQTVENQYIDIVAEGDAEESFPSVVDHLEAGSGLDRVKGIWHKSKRITCNGPSKPFDLNMQRDLPFGLLDMRRYLGKEKRLMIETSRGCPSACTYCSANRHPYNAMSPEKAVDLIQAVSGSYHLEHIALADSNFFF
ncbi:MAG: cobalamin-dependent protein [archaeon]